MTQSIIYMLLVGMENGYSHLGNQFGGFLGEKQKTKLSTILQPSNCISGHYPREMKTYVDTKPVLECLW